MVYELMNVRGERAEPARTALGYIIIITGERYKQACCARLHLLIHRVGGGSGGTDHHARSQPSAALADVSEHDACAFFLA